MNEEQKQAYKTKYYQVKQNSPWKFWPDIIYKDLLVSFALFLLLIGLAAFIGVANEPKADPNDYSYVPRPEWYFLFLFQMLKYFPGVLEWVGTVIIPGVAIGVLFLLPFIDRNPARHWSKRRLAIAVMTVVVIGIIGLTVLAVLPAPSAEGTAAEEEEAIPITVAEKVVAGQDLYSIHCAECHGAEGEGGEVIGVEGFEGVTLNPLNAPDVMYTRTDDTLFNVIAYGQQDLENAMPPFGLAYGGELQTWQMESIVFFMRYTWDDRVEMPAEAVLSSIPELKEGELPSYEIHVQPIIKRYCISCHRPGKKNNNYTMQTYDEILNSGDNAPVILPGNPDASLFMRLVRREELDEAGPMPPTKELKPEYASILELWIAAGAPQSASDAAASNLPASTITP
ncbi:MAG: c-type cytochrome [Anaerolineales bacterium]|jgi:mono/diheme cytochrome c family protein|nr:c-type cytochrome [Anaerolineales bacterium]